ncbi:MAG: hypothetical protein Kow00128_20510 [Deltaproteobacteria bacterium]
MPIRRCRATIERVCDAFRIDSLRPRLSALAEGLDSGGVVDIAVLGQFKAGKSSFLNSLLEREVVPVHVLPATSVVTRIGFGPADRAIVRHLTGETEEIAIDRLAEFVTEKENPENEKQVSLVEVELSSLDAFDGIRFVDTPGLGSIFSHNTQASMDWLPHVGGALVAVSVNHPFSGQDLSLLSEVFRHTPEAAILLTKADLVEPDQLAAVMEFTREQIARQTGRELPILPFSIRPSHAALRAEVLSFLRDRIVAGREERFRGIMRHKAKTLLAECRSYLRLALAAAESAGKAREELSRVLGRERQETTAIRSETAVFARDLKTRVRSAAGEKFHAHRGDLAERLVSAMDRDSEGWTGNFAETTRRFQAWLGESLERELLELSGRGEEYLSPFLLEAQSHLNRTVRAFQDRLSAQIEAALGIPFEGAAFHAAIREPSHPDVRVGRIFDIHLDLLWFLIPMALARRPLLRHFRKRIVWEAEKNLSRLSSQWAEAVNGSIDLLVRQAMEFVSGELATIGRLVAGAADNRDRIRQALEEIDAADSL